MEITYDQGKQLSNIEKHGLDFADLDLDFFETAIVRKSHSGRAIAINEFQGRLVIVVVFAPLGSEAISIISMRPASSKERKLL